MADISKTDIANMALSHLGKGQIEILEEDSPSAGYSRLWYDHGRRYCLKAHNWTFARKRQLLALHDQDPPAAWSFRYQYPADCLAAREIENPVGASADAVPYEVEMSGDGGSKSILTNEEQATLVYTFDQETTAFFGEHFVQYLSYMMAHYMAMPLTGSERLRAGMLTIARALRREAPVADAGEKVASPPRQADWTRAR